MHVARASLTAGSLSSQHAAQRSLRAGSLALLLAERNAGSFAFTLWASTFCTSVAVSKMNPLSMTALVRFSLFTFCTANALLSGRSQCRLAVSCNALPSCHMAHIGPPTRLQLSSFPKPNPRQVTAAPPFHQCNTAPEFPPKRQSRTKNGKKPTTPATAPLVPPQSTYLQKPLALGICGHTFPLLHKERKLLYNSKMAPSDRSLGFLASLHVDGAKKLAIHRAMTLQPGHSHSLIRMTPSQHEALNCLVEDCVALSGRP